MASAPPQESTDSTASLAATVALSDDLKADVAAVQLIGAVPRILEVICRSTGMGFAAVARVTEDRWICCAVRDEIAFGTAARGRTQGQNHHL
jgi:hypothetical protein